MATGFVQRFKGKIALAQGGLYIGGTQYTGSGSDLNTVAGTGVIDIAGPTGSTVGSGGVTILTSTAIAVYNLQPPVNGRSVIIDITTVSTAWMVKAATGVTILDCLQAAGGSSLTNTIKSTSTLVGGVITLIGVSTSSYVFQAQSPSTATLSLLFSTAT
jgi:hypothetical protein